MTLYCKIKTITFGLLHCLQLASKKDMFKNENRKTEQNKKTKVKQKCSQNMIKY